MPKLVGVNDSGQIVGQALAAVQSVVEESVGPLTDLGDAVALGKTATASEDAYQKAVEEADVAANGVILLSDDVEVASEYILNYGAVFVDSASANTGSKVVRLPYDNVNTATGKPIHIYRRTPFTAVAGRKYRFRVAVRSMGDIAPDAGINFIIAKPNGTNNPIYVAATSATLMTSAKVTTSGWTIFSQDWTALESTDYIVGPRAYKLTSDVQVDGPLEVRDASVLSDMSAQLATAKAKRDADSSAAVEAWKRILPAGALSGSESDGDTVVRTVSISRANYQALTEPDPNVLYLVTS